MALSRSYFEKVLEDSFSAYYNIYPDVEFHGLPLVYKCEYFSRSEKFWLTKKMVMYANETNEYAYIFSAPEFDTDSVNRCVDLALEDMLPLVKPHKEHQYTNCKVIFLADSLSKDVIKTVKKRKFTKSYGKLSLEGYTTLHVAAVDMSLSKTYTNPAAHEMVKYFRKLFAARKNV